MPVDADTVTRRVRRPANSNPAEEVDTRESSKQIKPIAKNLGADIKQNLISENESYVTEERLRNILKARDISSDQQVTEQFKNIKEQMKN